MLKNKKIMLGISGGIAAYKSAILASQLTQRGATVKVVMTDNAKQFITPLTFQALTRERVYDDTFAEKDPEIVSHIDVVDWADFILIAPATANVIGKIANGIADDMLTTSVLASTCPIYLSPAMNVNMYNNPAVQDNMATLKKRGYHFIEPGEGYLACGWVGKGRMAEPLDIISYLEQKYEEEQPFREKKILVTAGPTYEYADPVRIFTNPSSGKMGFAIAEVAASFGADVTLVSGPVQLKTPPHVKRVDVTTAEEMYEAVIQRYDDMDIVIKAAAVADYKPVTVDEKKTKKDDGKTVIEMERTKDILAALGERKKHQILVGFAAESHDLEKYAKGKLERKNLDMIVANDITRTNAGFRSDTNEMILIKRNEDPIFLPLLTKKETAKEILRHVESIMQRTDK